MLSFVQVTDFSLGDRHTLVLTVHNHSGLRKLWSFGSNEFGQLGRNSETASLCYDDNKNRISCQDAWAAFRNPELVIPVDNPQPEQVPEFGGFSGITMMAAGGSHTLAVASDGRVWCFGANDAGQCGVQIGAFTTSGGDYHLGNVVPLLLHTMEDPTGRFPEGIPPSQECCTPRSLGSSACKCASNPGTWPEPPGSVCQPCPLEAQRVMRIQAGKLHSVIQTVDRRLWTFGINAQGQLVRTNGNIGLSNANTYAVSVPPTTFGDGNQPIVGYGVGGGHTAIQTYRPYCRPGNHSMDRRSPCLRCEPGTYSTELGALSQHYYSFDQSAVHSYSRRYNVTYKATAVYLSCVLCPAGEFSGRANSTFCGHCGPGNYSFSGASVCHDCANGTFTNQSRAHNCTLCPRGMSADGAATSCYFCRNGTHAPVEGSEFCIPCAKGSYTNMRGQSHCIKCPVEFYQNTTGQTFCFKCPSLKLTATEGSTSINDCADLCPSGEYGPPIPGGVAGGRPCSLCP
jgi:hypothetical protein